MFFKKTLFFQIFFLHYGDYYGRFTINIYDSDSSSISKDLRDIYDYYDGDLDKVRKSFCE
tara:strand:- start:498 stop:677 length:180 start_codon:yes stop_codon:yes gene_type:complete